MVASSPCIWSKTSRNRWRKTIHHTFTDLGLHCSDYDPALYYCDNNGVKLVLAIHVDDVFGWCDDKRVLQAFIDKLSQRHKLTYTYEPKWLLHMGTKVHGSRHSH